MRAARFSTVQRHAPDLDLGELSAGISRLACHPGFDRSEIVSPKLRRFLPFRRQADAVEQEARAKGRLATAGLDPKTLDYLLRNVAVELELAASRLSPAC